MNFWTRLFGRKQSQARTALALNQVGRAVPTSRNYEAFAKEGYQINVIAYKCVSIISRAASGISWTLYNQRQGGEPTEIQQHPLLDLIQRPNPMQGQAAFFESLIAYYLIAGNSYLEAVGPSPNAEPIELWPLRPDKMRIIPGKIGLPEAYEFMANQKRIVFPVDQISGKSQILHMKTFHPTDNWYGMSPIEAAMYSVDQHNESGVWNLSLLKNMATPSGVVTVQGDSANPLGTLPDVQFHNVREQLRQKMEGSQNAGRVLLLEGGMDWKQMGFSPKDMDWMEGRKMSARDIALAFGVPPIILNIPGDSTFANYKEARLSLYEDTIIPLMDLLRDELNKWLTPRFGESLKLDYDVDTIVALDTKRSEKFSLISGAGFLTINEKRAAVGYEPIDGGDTLLVPSGQMPLEFAADTSGPQEEPTEPVVQASNEGENSQSDDTEEGEDADENLQEEDEKSIHSFELIGTKQINPLGKRDRIRTWKNINRMRDKLTAAFALDLKEDFDEIAKAIERAAGQTLEPKTMEFAVLKAIAEETPKLKNTIKKHFKRAVRTFGLPILESGKDIVPNNKENKAAIRFLDFQERYAEAHAAESVGLIEGTNLKKAREKIRKLTTENIAEGEPTANLARELRKEFESLSSSRAQLIARTEVGIASNEGALEAARALDIPQLMKEWVSVQDDRTRPGDFDAGNLDVPNHIVMNGERVPIDEKFIVPPGDAMDGPQEPGAPAGQIINCRCVLVFERG